MESLSAEIRENYRAAIKMLERIRHSSIKLTNEACTQLQDKPQTTLTGFSRLTNKAAIGIPDGAKLPIKVLGNGSGQNALAFTIDPMPWMTLEAFLAIPPGAGLCTVEIDLRAIPPQEVLADVFIRTTDETGKMTDTAPKTVSVGQPDLIVVSLDLDPAVAEASEARLIISLREPKGKFELHRCDVIVV